MPNNLFMDKLEIIILTSIGITVVAFVIIAYVVCKIYDKRNKDE
jgi:hypothetical protein